MNVCHIGFSRYPGVGSISMYEHSINLAALGLNIQVIAAGEKEEEKRINNLNIFLVNSASVKKLSVYPLLFVYAVLSYCKKFPDKKFDIIHVYYFPGCFLLPLLLKNKGKKWVFFTTSGPIQGGITSCIGWRMQSFESRFFDLIILRDESHKPPFVYRKDEITIVPIGADFNLFSPGTSFMREKYGIEPSVFLFLYVGNLLPVRKIETLIDALKIVLKTKKAALMVVGSGGTQRLTQYAQEVGVKDYVIFTGEVPFTDVPEYMRCCDIFLSYVPITPEFDIQPPLKTVEALACGLPVIATNTLGNRRFITHKENGYLTGDDVSSVADSMLVLMENEALRQKLKMNARPSAADHHWKAIVKERLLPAYKNILKGL
jgi:glycosyltransferase involved in cell wall biosynthesis